MAGRFAEGVSIEWVQVLLGIAATAIIGLVAAVWVMLKERIALLREEFNRRLTDQERQREADQSRVDKEIETLRKARHNLVDRLSAMETFIKFFVVKKHPSQIGRKDDDDEPEL